VNNDGSDASPHLPLTRDTIVGHYKIIEKIGAGGMGEVWLAEDTELNRKVALKFLPTNHCQDEDCRARFKREAQATAALKHSNIVTIYEVAEHNGRPFFAMEYLEGRSLDEVIKSKDLSVDQAIDLAIQLCEGLYEAHQAGVIHRDIKPSNIILDKNNRPKLLDFGLATVKGAEKLTKTGSTLGTIGYMSPEQVSSGKIDQRSDLFSLGVVIYEMVTGKAPFAEEYDAATLNAILHETPEPMAQYKSGVPDYLQRVVSTLLEKDPDLRYQSAEGVLPDLKQLTVPGSRDRKKRPSTPKEKLRKAILPTSVIALIILLVLIIKPWRFEIISDNPAVAAPRRLAVLYLKNRGSADDEYLSYGITEDLIVDLTRIGTMGVAPMPSILKYKDSDEELKEIAKHLNVGLVLNGSIDRSGDRIRVSAQLIDVEKESNLWADRWEETFENLPRIKEALAQGISQALEIDTSVMRAAQVGTPDAENPVAYDHYLRGKYTFEHKSDEADVEVALGLFRKALELEPSLLAARRGVAAVLTHKGQYDEANDELKTALEGARQRNLRSDEAEALTSLAVTHYKQSLYDEAQEYAEKAMDIYKELNDLAGEVRALTQIINIYQGRGMYNEAVVLFERVLEINSHLDDQHALSGSLASMAGIYISQGDYEKALQNYEQALEISTRLGNQSLMASITQNIGIVYYSQGDYAKALQNFEQALEIKTQIGDRAGMAMVLNNIGVIYMNQGDYEKALQNYEQALEIKTQIGDRAGMAGTINNIGVIYVNQGDYEKALQNYEQALEIRTQIGDRAGMASAIHNIGVIYADQGDYEKALQNYEQALEILIQIGDRAGMAYAMLGIGNIYADQGDYEKALQNYEQALEIRTQVGDRSGMAYAMLGIGNIYAVQGDYEKALQYYEQALEIRTQIGDRAGKADATGGIASVYGEQGDYRKSLEYARKSAEIRLELGTPIDSVWASYIIAAVIANLGECDKAISTLGKVVTDAAQLGNAELISGAHRSLGMAYFYKGESERAKEDYYAALKGYEEMGNRSSMAGANCCLGELYYLLNAPDSSRKCFDQSLALAEDIGVKKIRVRASAYLAALTARGGDFDGGVKQLRAILEEAKGHGNIENKVIVRRLLGRVLIEGSPSETGRQEGRTIMQDALSLATEQGYAHEIRWINELLTPANIPMQ